LSLELTENAKSHLNNVVSSNIHRRNHYLFYFKCDLLIDGTKPARLFKGRCIPVRSGVELEPGIYGSGATF